MADKAQVTSAVERTSKLFPEVAIVLHMVTEGRRRELRTTQAPLRKKYRQLEVDREKVMKALGEDAEKWDAEGVSKLGEIAEEAEVVDQQLTDNWINWGLARVSGLVVDGKELGKADILDFPETLRNEIVELIKAETSFSETEVGNLRSRTTSSVPAAGGSKPSIAESASEADSISTETATPVILN